MSEQTYQPTGLTHEIKTIEQFADLVTEENINYILNDFRITLELLLDMEKLSAQGSKIQSKKHEKIKLTRFAWVDDGKNEIKEFTISGSDDDMKLVIKRVEE